MKTPSWYNLLMDLDQIRYKSLPVLKEAGVLRSAVFGSYARGEAREDSDIDLLVEFPEGKSLLDLVILERKLRETLGKEVDVVTYNSVSPLLKEYIQKDQVQIL